MALLLRRAHELYRHVFDELSDPRTSEWFMVGGPANVALLLTAYLYFVLSLGPRLMEHRKPFNLDKIMIVYNALQVVASLHVVREALILYFYDGYSLLCQPVDHGTSESAMRAAAGFWFYYMLKIVDLLDTVFFVLRKKSRQISFLHVYHHTGMILIGYNSTKFLPGGHGVFVGLANSIVHAFLYSHYLISILYPKYARNGWYKKHLTQMQMVQFAMIVVHYTQILFMPGCAYPKFTIAVIVPQNLFLGLLFYDFYRRTYFPKDAKKRPETAVTEKTDSRAASAEVAAALSSAKEAVSPDASQADRRAG
ncbi:elongation of very long chain fatty acids protein 7-like [Thrips palmi]|uniref:Elongation of very long chain fatty acids protein n=1 Tax=Thrips palmi TaxID=161013 RepID=A0A6P8YXN5_THRPL|nr:elongation of very long chain fatty acids protein 7-like [Thrips palmi]